MDCGAIGQDRGTDGERVQNPGTTQLSVSTVMGTLQLGDYSTLCVHGYGYIIDF